MNRRRIYIRLVACICIGFLLMQLPGKRFLPLLLYLETGRQLSIPAETAPPESTAVPESLPTLPIPTQPPEVPLPAFSSGDLTYIDMAYFSEHRPDLGTLLSKKLAWDLTGPGPTVLIIHTHGTESFSGTDGYRSQNCEENMISIGTEVKRILEANGIGVIHDTTLHDYPSYTKAYSNSRKAVQRYLAQHPTIQLVLDLHRDASGATGGELITSATVGGQKSAQLMMVVGTSRNDHWEDNLALALKLSAALEQYNPGICRPVSLRDQRFNMDLSPGSILVEVGAAGNSHQEAVIAANALAQSILYLSRGTQ